jgi:hypothetical protein
MATRSLRIDENLVLEAQRQAKIQHRSINGQVEYWAKLGKAVASKISAADAFAVSQGLKELHLTPVNSRSVDPGTVLEELESDRNTGFSHKPITSAPFYFEMSAAHPGFLDKVNRKTGERQTGQFQNGLFEAI